MIVCGTCQRERREDQAFRLEAEALNERGAVVTMPQQEQCEACVGLALAKATRLPTLAVVYARRMSHPRASVLRVAGRALTKREEEEL